MCNKAKDSRTNRLSFVINYDTSVSIKLNGAAVFPPEFFLGFDDDCFDDLALGDLALADGLLDRAGEDVSNGSEATFYCYDLYFFGTCVVGDLDSAAWNEHLCLSNYMAESRRFLFINYDASVCGPISLLTVIQS